MEPWLCSIEEVNKNRGDSGASRVATSVVA